jgi:hypothetical protein
MIEALQAHPRGCHRPGERLFRFHKGGGLDFKLIQATAIASGIEPPKAREARQQMAQVASLRVRLGDLAHLPANLCHMDAPVW